jgi:hypothetical protein
MKNQYIRYQIGLLSLALLMTSLATAAPVTFNFTFDDPGSSALAVGSITFEDTLVANPGFNNFALPDPAVLALTVTVTGASSGNGTFGINDFVRVVFDTNGGTFNFSAELVGQPTDGLPFGTQIPDLPPAKAQFYAGDAGDLNLFSVGGITRADSSERYANRTTPAGGIGPLPPEGVFWFLLGADGGTAEAMALVSMAPAGGGGGAGAAPIAVPTLGFWASLILCLGLVGVALTRGASMRKRASRD